MTFKARVGGCRKRRFYNKRGVSAAQAALARILALPGLEAFYAPYIPGLTLPFVGTTNASSWPDSSGKGRPLLQATGAAQPLIVGGSLLFNGTTMWMQALFSTAQPETTYIGYKQVVFGAQRPVFDGATADSMELATGLSDGAVDAFAGSHLSLSGVTTGQWQEVGYVANGAGGVLRTGAGLSTTGASGANNSGGLTIAAKGSGSNFNNIQAYFGAKFSVSHDTATQLQMLADMATLRLAAGIT